MDLVDLARKVIIANNASYHSTGGPCARPLIEQKQHVSPAASLLPG